MTAPLRVVIVHYHLRRGGVTSVIRHAVTALRAQGADVLVLAGSHPEIPGFEAGEICRIDALDYDDAPPSESAVNALLLALQAAVHNRWGNDPVVWHVHNHTLGKNGILTRAVLRLAQDEVPLILQIHDFPEEGRSRNYARLRATMEALSGGLDSAPELYPLGAHIQYAVLNARDHDVLTEAGAPPDHICLLPNAVDMDASEEPRIDRPVKAEGGRRLFLYPTRAIRRKNIGEFILWAACADLGDQFAVTLAPTSPTDVPPYRQWQAFAQELHLPVQFEVGLNASKTLTQWFREATATITTSVMEGFGMAFLEPWSLSRPMLGRDLPDITRGLKDEGLDLSHLYEALWIPLEWIPTPVLRQCVEHRLSDLYRAYGRSRPAAAADAFFATAIHGDRIDFGRLDERLQMDIIRRVRTSPQARRLLSESTPLPRIPDRVWVERNRSVIERQYRLDTYGRRLTALYDRAFTASPIAVKALSPEIILSRFLDPRRLSLLTLPVPPARDESDA